MEAITLDHFALEHRPPAVVKIDVEGAEEQVLEGAEAVFRESQPILICEIHDASSGRGCIQVAGGARIRMALAHRERKFSPASRSSGAALGARMTEPRQRWVAILGRRGFPTDGVQDYCTFLQARRCGDTGLSCGRRACHGLRKASSRRCGRSRTIARRGAAGGCCCNTRRWRGRAAGFRLRHSRCWRSPPRQRARGRRVSRAGSSAGL